MFKSPITPSVFAKIVPITIAGVLIMSSPSHVHSIALNTATKQGQNVVEQEGGFAYTVPNGWRIQKSSLSKFRTVFAPVDGSGFTANVVFTANAFDGDLRSFRNAVVEEIKTLYGNAATLVSETNFQTKEGAKGIKLVFNLTTQGLNLRSTNYLIDLNPRKLSVTYTRLRDRQRQHDKEVESLVANIKKVKEESSSSSSSRRHVEPSGGFSYIIPSGWTQKDSVTSPFKTLIRTGGKEHATVSFTVVNDESRVPIDDTLVRVYSRTIADRLQKQMGTPLEQIRVVESRLFKTKNGYNGARFVVTGTLADERMRFVQYFVEIGTGIVIAVYLRVGDENPQEQRSVDQLIDSLAPAD